MSTAKKYPAKTLIFESSYTGHRSEHVRHLMRFINAQPNLSGHYLFVLNEQMKPLLGELVDSENYTIVFSTFDKKHSNAISRSFWEWNQLEALLRSYTDIKEIIFLDIDPYLVLIASNRFKRHVLSVRGTLFQPYIHYKKGKNGLLFFLNNYVKTYLFQKLAVVSNARVQKVFILNDEDAVNALNKNLKNVFSFLPDPIETLSCETDAGSLQGIVQKYKIDKSKKNLLMFGSMDGRKNLINILDALAALPAEIRSQVHLMIAGRFHPSVQEQYIGHIEKNAAHISITYTNEFVTDMEREVLFQHCDLVLMPYINFFGSSGILGHAIKNNKNVIVSKEGLVGKLVQKNRLGLTVDPLKPEEIKNAILQLLSDTNEAQYDGKRFLDEYSPANYSQKVLLN